MKKLIVLLVVLAFFTTIKAQDTVYVYQERGMIRIENLETNPIFMTPNVINYRLRGSNFVLKDGYTKQEYTIGTYDEIFDEDTTAFVDNDAVINYLNGFISNYSNRDATTDAITTINFEHHEMHEGDHFFITDYLELSGAGDSAYFSFTTPNTDTLIHARSLIDSDAEITVTIFEAATLTGGTPITFRNNNRNISNGSVLTGVSAPTVTDQGTQIWRKKTGTAKSPTGVSPGLSYEIIAKKNTTYLFKLQKSVTGICYVNYDFFYYQHKSNN